MTKTERENTVQPFLRWVGGKQRLLPRLKDYLPQCEIRNYFEPFLGAGSLFLDMGFKGATLSDLNPHLINAYEQIQHSPNAVSTIIEQYRNTFKDACREEYYYQERAKFNENREVFDVEQAARFIFLIHTNYNGVYRVNKSGAYNVPYGKIKQPALPTYSDLQKVSIRLAHTRLLNCHYAEIEPLVGQGDFVYLDPPYPELSKTAYFNGYTINKFSEQDQKELAAFANWLRLRGAFVMISNAEVPLIEELYPFKHWYRHNTSLLRNVSAKRPAIKVGELIITSYPTRR